MAMLRDIYKIEKLHRKTDGLPLSGVECCDL